MLYDGPANPNSPFAELLVQWPDHGSFADYTKSAHTDIGQVSTDDSTRLYDDLATQHDVLGATQDSLPADTVTGNLKGGRGE